MSLSTEQIQRLSAVRAIEITTTGRRSGRPTRVEIWWFHVDGRFVITGTPGPRDWIANLRADPTITVHTPVGDHLGRIEFVTDVAFRRRVFTDPAIHWYSTQAELETLVSTAPMVEVLFG
jgi:hypothetical protein